MLPQSATCQAQCSLLDLTSLSYTRSFCRTMTSLLRSLRPVDRILILFNVGFAVLWLCALGRSPYALLLFVSHAAAIAVALLCVALGPKPSMLGRGLRELYPIVLIALYWLEIGMVRDVFHTPPPSTRSLPRLTWC